MNQIVPWSVNKVRKQRQKQLQIQILKSQEKLYLASAEMTHHEKAVRKC